MQICINCKEPKELTEFYHNKNAVGGYMFQCKVCKDAYNIAYKRTLEGTVCRIWGSQRTNSRLANRDLPNYTKDRLRVWLMRQHKFFLLYAAWVNSGYLRKLVPSVDRIDNSLPYTLKNIQLMTWEENNKKR